MVMVLIMIIIAITAVISTLARGTTRRRSGFGSRHHPYLVLASRQARHMYVCNVMYEMCVCVYVMYVCMYVCMYVM